MKQVNEITEKAIQPQRNYSRTQIGEKAVINQLFATIKVAYPHFLKDQEETSTKRMWAAHLRGFSDERIETAAKDMVDKYPTFAPTLGEFKALLRELNVANPESLIGMDLTCPNCRGHRKSQHHLKECGS